MKRAEWVLGISWVLAFAAAGCSASPVAQNPAAAPVAARPAAAVPAAGEPLEILSVLSVEHEVDLQAEREGAVLELLKDEGSSVRRGEILARLDDRSTAAQLDKAKADLTVTEQNVQYNEAEVRAKQAAFRRQQELRKLGLSSDADLEAAEFQAKGAGFDLKSWQAVVQRNQAEIRVTQAELEKTRIRAPFDGMMARRYIRQGQDVVKGDKCFRISQLSPLRVQFQVPENSSRHPRAGDTVNVILASDSQEVYSAKISRVSPTVDPASGSYDLTAQLTGPNLSRLRPGMAVRVEWAATASKP